VSRKGEAGRPVTRLLKPLTLSPLLVGEGTGDDSQKGHMQPHQEQETSGTALSGWPRRNITRGNTYV